jgi:hypothetical protein
MMMIIVGSVHITPRRDFRYTVQEIRGQLVQHCGLDMPISTLQAFCLCHVHDTWYGNKESQFVAQCMWPIMVAHSRKKGIGVAGRPEHEAQEEEAWAAWAKDEGKVYRRSELKSRTTSRGILRAPHGYATIGLLEPALIKATVYLRTQSQLSISTQPMGRYDRLGMDPSPRTGRLVSDDCEEAAPQLHARLASRISGSVSQ